MERRIQYNCPYEGLKCKHKKHCVALVTTEPLRQDLQIRVKCSVVKEATNGSDKERIVLLKAS